MGQLTALIGFLGVLLGIMLGKGLEAAIEKRRRWNREIDMVFALHAEISAGLKALQEQCKLEHQETFMQEPYPAGPAGRTDFVFQSLKGNFSLLPQSVIHQIVLYYRLAEESNILLDYLSNDTYKKLSSSRKKAFRGNAMQSFSDQLTSARQALERLEPVWTIAASNAQAKIVLFQTRGRIGPLMNVLQKTNVH